MIRSVHRLCGTVGGTVGITVSTILVLCAAFAPILARQNPYDLAQLNIMDSLLPPGSKAPQGYIYYFGTDDQGRDLVSAVLYGLRVSLVVAACSTSIALIIGVVAGLCAAYAGGRVDAVIMRLADLQLAFPSVLTALVLVALLGSGLDKVVIAIVAAQWASYARTLRSAAIVERTKDYIQAASMLRYSTRRIMVRHLLPNSISPLGVMVVIEMAGAITLEATLSFLGVGLSVTRPSLGLLIANGYTFMLSGQYWVSVYPGIVLVVLLFSINLIGERLREINDPHVLGRA